jgi:hypothetical protein
MQSMNRRSRCVAVIAACSLALHTAVPVLAAAARQQPVAPASGTTAKPAAAVPATGTAAKSAAPPAKTAAAAAKPVAKTSASATDAVALDGGWPRMYDLPDGGTMLVYQPQVSAWEKQSHLVGFSAVSYRPKSGDKAAMGTVKLEADTKVSVGERLVNMEPMKIVEASFPTLPKEQVQGVVAAIEKTIPREDRVLGLDRVLANIEKSGIMPKTVEGLKADPPAIFFSKTPAVIVNLDGEPVWSPIKDNDLKFAVNTNWDLFQHTPTGALYLRNNDGWLTSATVQGPWKPAGKLPGSFAKLPAEENWKEVKASLPGKAIAAAAVPHVFVSLQPAELILLTGEPKYTAVTGTPLLWVSNTESDLFRLGAKGSFYYLVAGRWFSAADLAGPWTFATPSLPAEFKKIPLEHPRSRVLASVPGTDSAAEAVLLAQIPQTARVNRKEVKAPEVAFQGNPEFAPIETTPVQRAVNTDKDVFKIDGRFYMCYQGVWFTGGTATGPWEVATSVPEQIYKIPVSSPAHHVTYVTVEDSSDEWVTYATAAGYTGMMVGWGCAVWGSGYYYPPYIGYGGYYPYYYPYFPTYGYSAWYNPWTGAYGRSAAVYGPYGGAGVGARYNPRTGTYARGAAAYGPYGARGVAQAYNPRTGTYASTRQGSNVYGSWGSTAVQRGDDWARTNRYTNRQTGATTRTIRTDEGGAVTRTGAGGAKVGVGDSGNVYAGNDGNVYRRQDGNWQKYDNGGWSSTDRQPGETPRPKDAATGTGNRPATTAGGTSGDRGTIDQLNRDSKARSEGTQRTSDYGSYRSGSGTSGTGSYRSGGASRSGGGGASRGGGGRRR